MAVISGACHLKQMVPEAFGIVGSKFIVPRAFWRVLSVRICFVLAADEPDAIFPRTRRVTTIISTGHILRGYYGLRDYR
jgi:hypothetical protein